MGARPEAPPPAPLSSVAAPSRSRAVVSHPRHSIALPEQPALFVRVVATPYPVSRLILPCARVARLTAPPHALASSGASHSSSAPPSLRHHLACHNLARTALGRSCVRAHASIALGRGGISSHAPQVSAHSSGAPHARARARARGARSVQPPLSVCARGARGRAPPARAGRLHACVQCCVVHGSPHNPQQTRAITQNARKRFPELKNRCSDF